MVKTIWNTLTIRNILKLRMISKFQNLFIAKIGLTPYPIFISHSPGKFDNNKKQIMGISFFVVACCIHQLQIANLLAIQFWSALNWTRHNSHFRCELRNFCAKQNRLGLPLQPQIRCLLNDAWEDVAARLSFIVVFVTNRVIPR